MIIHQDILLLHQIYAEKLVRFRNGRSKRIKVLPVFRISRLPSPCPTKKGCEGTRRDTSVVLRKVWFSKWIDVIPNGTFETPCHAKKPSKKIIKRSHEKMSQAHSGASGTLCLPLRRNRWLFSRCPSERLRSCSIA